MKASRMLVIMVCIVALILLTTSHSFATNTINDIQSTEDFIEALKIVLHSIVRIILIIAVGALGPYMLVKACIKAAKAPDRPDGSTGAWETFIWGCIFITFPFIISLILMMIKNAGNFGQNLYNAIATWLFGSSS